ncbi:hypothetical protein M0R45_030504 [Rubus argutus]|uniref:Retroviral polymerase SH3-like domain-containing protein n=1 Tax=Rubus argutus TaxID=59490 RepID=A0AAW1WFD5_RUBAR
MNMVRCMLCDKQVPKTFWPEAARWTVHVPNRSPTLVVKDKTPEEMWSGVKPKVDYFRVFGCLAHVHVPNQKRTKLDDKSLQCVLLGGRIAEAVKRDILIWEDSIEDEDAFSESEEEVVDGTAAVVTDQETEATTSALIESSHEVAPVQAETRIRRAPLYL